MLRAMMRARMRARARPDERGFTIIETMIAITIIFSCLTALAFTATSGFRYISLARERQSATGLATRVMEEARALDTTSLARGLRDSDLTTLGLTDTTNVKSGCAGDPAGTYRFLSCTGDKIVHSSYSTTVTPLAPYTGTVAAGGAYGYPAAYTWKVYVTNNDATKYPYAITVQVAWTAGAIGGAAKSIMIQGLSFSPQGCAATTVTHPYAGPCQPYVTGSIVQAQGKVRVQGTVNGSPVDATLSLPYVQVSGSAEQVAQVQASVTQGSGSSGTTSLGGASIGTLADGNPSTSTGSYDPASPATPPKTLTASAWSLPLLSSSVTLADASSGSIGSAISATSANSSSAKCPSATNPWTASENDGAPCAWARVQQNGALSTMLNISTTVNGDSNELMAGQGAVASVAAAGTPTNAYFDRVLSGATAGRLDMNMSRTLGAMQFLAVPAGFFTVDGRFSIDGTSQANLDAMRACTGGNYPLSVSNYTDSANASAGLSATAPIASVTGASVKFWDGAACNSYTGVSSSTSVPPFPGFSVTRTHAVTGGPVAGRHTWSITYKLLPSTTPDPIPPYAKFGGVTTTRTPSTGTTITKATSTASAPVDAVLHYQIIYTYDTVATTMADLTVTINLGSLTTTSQYTAAPTGG